MTRSIFVTATQRGSGKSTVALGLVSLLERTLSRVGYFKPICQRNESGVDPDVRLMKDALGLSMTVEEMEPITMEQVQDALANGTLDQLMDDVLDAFQKVQDESDFVVCEGTDYFGAMASLEFDINARVAKDLGSPILLVAHADAPNGDGDDGVLDNVRMIKESFDEKNCDFFGVILNRADAKRYAEKHRQVEPELARHGIRLLGTLPRVDMLEKPRLEEVAAALGAEVISGKERLNVIAHKVEIGAMGVENVLYHLSRTARGALMVVPGDRDDVLLGLAAAYASPAVPAPAGVVITGGLEPSQHVRDLILDLTEGRMPMLKVPHKTYEAALRISEVKPKLRAHQRTRIEIVKGLVERHVNVEALLTEVAVGGGSRNRVTPKQFLHQLIYLARTDRKRIVLPEGNEERILRAAERLIARKVVDLTLLGEEDEIRKTAESLGVKLDGTRIIDPTTTEWRDRFAAKYVELRPPQKKPTQEYALEVMGDPTFFGTMMVHQGEVDGMVSGSINTTAQTLRPALQFVKTKEGVSIASSVFFMCLPSEVLVYGDCAVNPSPTAEQLADIAVASAQTARAFGIEPFVAMLSYSTGASGAGSEVDKVRQATELVKQRMPSLPVEGPIQYDAAVDKAVAKTKLPDSKVAGAATVFIFPDLNAGNVAYKAVQRSAGAIAVGPVMQGLCKPVNDLSRGCTVADIVNTVAITAIQAQADSKCAERR